MTSVGAASSWQEPSPDDEVRRLRGERELLLSELQHRTRNTLARIRAILSIMSETAGSIEDFTMHLEGRIDAIARAQAYVTHDPAAMTRLDMLIADEFMAIQVQEGGRLTMTGPPVRIPPRVAESLGLALHELATNALKFGAFSTSQGRVGVRWRVRAIGTYRQLLIEWRESDGPIVAGSTGHIGFGRTVLERSLPFELDAEVDLTFEASGVGCVIALPLTGLDFREEAFNDEVVEP